ncbi:MULTISPECIES: DUF6894 family protein [Rhizobium]|uniref:DUF6894 domain-containing protein n=2 Tax=Rhizobium TaxID=379 RepID=A0AAF1K615_9HYPH|nr:MULTISPECIES: hypothetical protein [Rhizobium]MBO9098411.1 hypothetical protein [Rhizobium sp. L58/93]MBO9132785.1 hypothetical protein [Rhizobium sp. B209b/85]MBO9168677.1 hypothetical protein [Rhizobium sp. L245/93]MBO9184627.1 hypothetical protein [Rhizobium sp. E27B/91]MBZ5758040.1 hypothetical protein [Rhizobium sp. VS19-DR96]
MAKFYFNISDNEGFSAGDAPFEYPTLTAAIDQAKSVLAEMAIDGIPEGNGRRLSVEVANDRRQPVVRFTIVLMVDYSPSDSA